MKENNKVINTNPRRFIIAGFLVIFCFFGGIVAWSVYFPFQGAVIASGTVKVFGERKVVQHLEGGIIDKIYVQEGDQVYKGDVLIELKSSQVNANVDLLQGRLWAKLAEASRLNAEINMDSTIKWSKKLLESKENEEVAQVMAKEQKIFKYRISDMQGKILLHNSQIKQLGNRIDGANEELKTQDEIIANLNEELQAKRPLFKDQYMGKSNILELERSLAQFKGRKAKLKQDIAEFFQMIQELKLRIVDIQNQYREKAVSRLGEVKDILFEIEEQIKPYLDARKRLKIRAPISGEIINLSVNSESGVIQSGMPLLEIVPANSKLIIEAQVRPQDIISVQKGQKTKVQLSAFQRKSTPPVSGKVVYISPDLISQQTYGGTVSYYVAHIEVNKKDLEDKNAYLSPGMPVACYITTDKRSVISYVLGPLLENVDRAMRE
jgi:epimerase transport system membrane fusion protein